MTPERLAELRLWAPGYFDPRRREELDECLNEITRLQSELTRLQSPRPAPRCPKCGSEWITVGLDGLVGVSIPPKWRCYCERCGEIGHGNDSIDQTLNEWRKP